MEPVCTSAMDFISTSRWLMLVHYRRLSLYLRLRLWQGSVDARYIRMKILIGKNTLVIPLASDLGSLVAIARYAESRGAAHARAMMSPHAHPNDSSHRALMYR